MKTTKLETITETETSQEIVEDIEEWRDFENFFYMTNEFPQPKNDIFKKSQQIKFFHLFYFLVKH
jgi:hypothetical protein